MSGYRIERDSMGELRVPEHALYGAQTQRAVNNFPISMQPMPRAFIRALGLIKGACAMANGKLGYLPLPVAEAIAAAANEVSDGRHDGQFPVDVFQTGSGTSSNMNANEVIANLAARATGLAVHPNDQVNFGQSSNDVVPSAIQVAAAMRVSEALIPSLMHLRAVIQQRAISLVRVVKTGRTHLMDAVPLTFGQEMSGWASQIRSAIERIADTQKRVLRLPLGGTAVGTGVNADARFGPAVTELLAQLTGCDFVSHDNYFEGIAAKDECVELSGQLNVLACALMKIANDLRWMNSGPLAGLGEIALPPLQPGSSIMPGKVNPVIPEATCMVCAQVMGNHTTITIAGQSGNFQLNVMLPVLARNLLESIELLSNVARLLADQAIAGFQIKHANVESALVKNPILVTALNPVIGYELGAATAKQAYQEGRAILDVALETTGLSEAALKRYLDPYELTLGGIKAGMSGGG